MRGALLFSTDALAFLDKPSGLLVHSSAWAGPREHALVDDVRLLLGEGWHPLHRLDRQTSGVVAFARAEVVSTWQRALANDDADKRYWALVRGHVRDVCRVDHAIKDDGADVGKPAVSIVTPLMCSNVERCSLVEVQLLTGRRHQARRHLKHIAHPVIGDATHGKGPLNRLYRARFGLARMALHARRLVLVHPETRARLEATAPLPEDLVEPLGRLFAPEDLTTLVR